MDASVGNRAPGLVPFVVCVGGRLHWEARRFIDELFGEHPDELAAEDEDCKDHGYISRSSGQGGAC